LRLEGKFDYIISKPYFMGGLLELGAHTSVFGNYMLRWWMIVWEEHGDDDD
jgi:hypothetical protein